MISNQRIKIVHLVRTLDIGGLEMVVCDLIRGCDRSRYEPYVLCLGARGELGRLVEEQGVPVIPLNIIERFFPNRLIALSRELRRLQPQILHTHNPAPHFNGAFAAKLAGISILVHTKHGRNYEKNPKGQVVLRNKIASRLSSKIVCVSHNAADVARKLEKIPERLISVIHNGIEISRFAPNPTPCASGKNIRAIHVARLNRVKDQATLLRSIRIVVDRQQNFQLDIVGDGPARDELIQLWSELSLTNNVRFHGMRKDVPEYLKSADLFVLSSVSEGISLTLLEAMASGLPTVVTDVGGNREVVVHKRTGLIVPPRDPEALANAILQVADDAELARQMGVQGRMRAEQHFSMASMVAAYEDLYSNLLRWPNRPPKVGRADVPYQSASVTR